MKFNKKWLAALLAILTVGVSAISLTACGGEPTPTPTPHTHDWNERVTKEAMCEEEGVLTYSCYCGEYYTVPLAALGHQLETIEAKEPNCTEFGWEAYELCQREGCGYTTYAQIEAKEHIFDKGYCIVEGCGVQQPPKDHIEHQWEWDKGIVTTEPTCTEKGVKTYTCWCTAKYTEPVAELGHDKQQHEGQAATCTETGWEAYETCKRDDCTFSTYEEIAINENNHDLDYHEGQAATCVAVGWYAYAMCKRCDCTFSTYEEIAINADNHNYVERICTYCGFMKPSEGLKYAFRDSTSYYVDGIGTCTDKEVVIPSTYNNEPVTSIDSSAFEECSSLTEIVIPDSVTSIGDSAFRGCSNITKIVIPDSVTSIDSMAFYECSSLTKVVIGDNVISIGSLAFWGCSNLTEVVIGDSVASIGMFAFEGTGYYNDENNWENDVLYIGKHLIRAKEDITGKYTIKEDTLCIARGVFYGCSSLTEIEIPDSVTSIGHYAFYACISLTEIEIPDCVTSIGDSAFGYCRSLREVVIPDSVTSIGINAFEYCSSLTSIQFEGTVEQWNDIEKGTSWDYNVPATEVVCSNGTVKL